MIQKGTMIVRVVVWREIASMSFDQVLENNLNEHEGYGNKVNTLKSGGDTLAVASIGRLALRCLRAGCQPTWLRLALSATASG